MISDLNVSTDTFVNDDTSSVTVSLKKAAKQTLYGKCRENMKNMFVRLRPEFDGHCKLTYSVNPLHCVGATRYQDAPLKGKVHIASIEINMKKRGYIRKCS